jgi:hypothetical protein
MDDFGRIERGPTGIKTRVLDEDKFGKAAKQWAIGARSATLDHYNNFLDRAKDLNEVYTDVLQKHVPGKNMDLSGSDVQNLLDAAVTAKQQALEQAGLIAKNAPVGPATAYQAIGGRLDQPAAYDKGVLGIGEAGLTMAGLTMMGVPHSLIGAAAVARGTLALMKGKGLPPAATVKVLAMIAKSRNAWESASDSAISGMLKHGGKASVLAPIIGEHLTRGPQDFQLGEKSHAGLSDAESFRQHSQDIAAQAVPPTPNNPLLTGAPLIGSMALSAHQNQLGVLHDALPPGSALSEHEQQANLFDKQAPVSPLDRQDFVNTWGLVHDPLIVIPLMQSGLVTSKTVATLQRAAPATYAALAQKLSTELAKLSPQERARLSPGLVDSMSTFLQRPLSSLQDPATILLAQNAGATQAQQPGPGMMPKRSRKPPKMQSAARAQTPNQAADAALRE